jgi:hypothetical protein
MKLTVMTTAAAALLSGGLMLRGSAVRALPVPVAAVAASAPDVRDQVKDLIRLEVSPLHTEAEVDAYLVTLQGRARRNRRVSPIEVAPGLRAVHQLVGKIPFERITDKELAFADAMAKIAEEVR